MDWPEVFDFSVRQALWTILVGLLCNSCCALLGCFLVLRKMSMLGDALAHAILPGLVLAFLITSSTAAWAMFLGAAVFAMLTAGLSRLLSGWGHTSEESGLGVVFTAFFAFGILLVQWFAENMHLDRDAVLEGAIEFVTLDTVEFAGRDWPISFWVTGGVLLLVVLWLLIFWKQVKAATFDPVYATAIGLHGQHMLGVMIVLVAMCVVAAFKVVGSVLVVAMLVVPAATAQLLSQRLSQMLLISVLCASVTTVVGYLLAREWNTSASGMMAVVAGGGYLAALLFSPLQGVVVTRLRRRFLQDEIDAEDLLAVLYRWQEAPIAAAPLLSDELLAKLAGHAFRDSVVRQLMRSGLMLRTPAGTLELTELGRRQGERVVRGHRLWESYLERQFTLPEDHLHQAAHQMEHFLDRDSQQKLEHELGSPTSDPHGRQIPRAETAAEPPASSEDHSA